MINNNKVLKLVEQPYYEKDIDLIDNKGDFTHSLQGVIPNFSKLSTNIPSYFIEKFTKKEECVLDPFCDFGMIPLEAILHERVAYASDIHALAVKVTSAKLSPVSFPELALALQMLDVKRLVRLGEYEKYFSPFFDIETYKEILSLKEYIQSEKSPISDFIELLMLSILHGATSKFCSVPTYQEISVSSDKQQEINIQYRIAPEYRAILPRLLKQSSNALADIITSKTYELSKQNKCYMQDPRNMEKFYSSSVDLILTELPLYYENDLFQKCWLKNWFCNLNINSNEYDFFDEISWVDFMAECLLEFARVLKQNKRIVFIIKSSEKNKEIDVAKVLLDLINKQMSKYFFPEKCLIQKSSKEDFASYKYLIIKRN